MERGRGDPGPEPLCQVSVNISSCKVKEMTTQRQKTSKKAERYANYFKVMQIGHNQKETKQV